MAYYHVLFDRTVDLAFEAYGFGPSYVEATGRSFFSVETHVCYLDEVLGTDAVEVSLRVIAADAKRVHVYEEMVKAGFDAPAATCETLLLHVDLSTRRTTPFPPEVEVRVAAAVERQAGLGWPERAGRRIALPPPR